MKTITFNIADFKAPTGDRVSHSSVAVDAEDGIYDHPSCYINAETIKAKVLSLLRHCEINGYDIEIKNVRPDGVYGMGAYNPVVNIHPSLKAVRARLNASSISAVEKHNHAKYTPNFTEPTAPYPGSETKE